MGISQSEGVPIMRIKILGVCIGVPLLLGNYHIDPILP